MGGVVGVGEEVLHLGEGLDVPVDLAVEDAAAKEAGHEQADGGSGEFGDHGAEW